MTAVPAPDSVNYIEGRVDRVLYHTEETGYAVLKVTGKSSRTATVIGRLPSVHAGETLEARGSWVETEAYGCQFHAEELSCRPPNSNSGLEKFLGSGFIDGIGPKYAKRIVEKFGQEIFAVLDTTSKRLEEVEGIGAKRRREIKASWEKHKAIRTIMVFLHQHGISSARAMRIYQAYGDQAEAVLRENPYQLVRDIHGIGFKTADELAKQLGTDGAAASRQTAALRHVLQTAAMKGHSALPKATLLDTAAKLLDTDGETLAPTLTQALESEDVIMHESLIFMPYLALAETQVAETMKRLANKVADYPDMDVEKACQWTETKLGNSLSEGQRAAISLALTKRIAIITGGPGVGKTTVLKSLLLILDQKQIVVVLAAPTGRAAKRMTESSGAPAKTLHRLLEYQSEGKFACHQDSRLKGTTFVIDEASMIDTPLMAALLQALPDDGHLVLLGDVDQLPSVGPGAVLRDMIQSEVAPVARLTEIFRQSAGSRILTAAHAINGGITPDLEAPDKGAKSDFYWFDRPEPEDALALLCKMVGRHIPDRFGLDAIKDVQVLTPMNRGLLGTANLNRELQARLNPPNEFRYEVDRFGSVYRVGDRVIQTRNNYDKEVFNGDLGHLVDITTDPVTVQVRFDADRIVTYQPAELDELQLAYAITIHKAQGSEFPAVVIPVSNQHYHLLQRSLMYTGVTRGKGLVVLVGDPKALELSVTKTTARRRYTALQQRLQA